MILGGWKSPEMIVRYMGEPVRTPPTTAYDRVVANRRTAPDDRAVDYVAAGPPAQDAVGERQHLVQLAAGQLVEQRLER